MFYEAQGDNNLRTTLRTIDINIWGYFKNNRYQKNTLVLIKETACIFEFRPILHRKIIESGEEHP